MRCFIALEVPADIRSQLASMITALQAADADVKWVDPANIHLTLKFLDEISQAQMSAVSAQLDTLRGRYQKIPLLLTKMGAFPDMKRPQTIWAGVEKTTLLAALFNDLEPLMSTIGLTKEQRNLKPHLTLGRVRSIRNAHRLTTIIAESRIASSQSAFSALTLFRSTLTPTGPRYQPLMTIGLE